MAAARARPSGPRERGAATGGGRRPPRTPRVRGVARAVGVRLGRERRRRRVGSRRAPSGGGSPRQGAAVVSSEAYRRRAGGPGVGTDRKSTRLNSSHLVISYAVFCLKKKKNKYNCSRLVT